jgi:hypothetical protein
METVESLVHDITEIKSLLASTKSKRVSEALTAVLLSAEAELVSAEKRESSSSVLPTPPAAPVKGEDSAVASEAMEPDVTAPHAALVAETKPVVPAKQSKDSFISITSFGFDAGE